MKHEDTIETGGDIMSMDKAIEHHKEFRKRYYGAKSIDPSCRNHGGCPACQENRTYCTRKRLMEWQSKLEDWMENL